MVLYHELPVQTHQRTQWLDITPAVQNVLLHGPMRNGLVMVSSLHTTAGITVNENADPDVGTDFFAKLNRMVPQEATFHHAEGNSDSHIKASLVGLSVQIPVQNGQCVLGTWQSIYFCEFYGPRNRRVSVTCIGE
jgi:secondary thiamine-phosphate synthase enzyme